jgi:hypothetical protein
MTNLEILIDTVLNPRKYYWIANVPGMCDAAEYLFTNCWDDISDKVKNRVESILLNSGKYKPI